MSGRHGDGSGRVRIIGGHLRNSRLDVPDLPGLRPTPERVRETLFNWLAPVIEGSHCLDLCAGTGALGIEALSRGAAQVRFVEPDALAARMLQANLQRLKVSGGDVIVMDAQRYLRGGAPVSSVVFLDPPFALALWSTLADQLEEGGVLAGQAWIYVESPRGTTPRLPLNWQLHRESHAGEVRFALYRRAHPLS